VLCTIGDLVEDVVVWPSGPLRLGTDCASTIRRRRGGSAANVAAAAATDGTRSRFVGRVGDDGIGARLIDDLRACGVDVDFVERAGLTGTIVVVVDRDGERSFYTDRGASCELEVVPRQSLDGVQVLHVPLYSFAADPLATATRRAVEEAQRRGIDVSVDASSVAVIESFGVDEVRGLLGRMSPMIVFADEQEAALLGWPGLTVVKRGSAPTQLRNHGSVVAEVPVPAIERVRDTTGAGDAFAAGYLGARLRGEEHPLMAVRHGHALAARVLHTAGAPASDTATR